MPLRFARWAAVSTREQAKPGKRSIANQLESTLLAGTSRGWVESAGPFVVDGQSREIYIDLSEAEREIPALHAMLQAARSGSFDILLLTETDRLRSLQVAILRRLASYHVQLFVVNLPIDPVDPEQYTIHRADNILMLLTMTQMTSSLEISRTRRKWFENMPRRVTELGLPATHIPYGYRKPPGHELDSRAVPEPDPLLVPSILEMKDLLLSGLSSYQIAEKLQKSLVEPPRGKKWHPVTVRDILKNPFYAGIVQWGKSRVILDPQTDTRKRDRSIPPDEIRSSTGRHVPLWDETVHLAILDEFRRRTRNFRGRRNNHFTGLLKCGVCGAPLWRQGNGPRGEYRLIWRCSATGSGKGHINIPHSVLLYKVGLGLQQAVEVIPEEDTPPHVNREIRVNTSALERKLARLEEGYLAEAFDLPTYKKRRAVLLEQIRAAQEETDRLQQQKQEQENNQQALDTLRRSDIPHWFATGDPVQINHVLRSVIAEIVIGPDIEIRMKQ